MLDIKTALEIARACPLVIDGDVRETVWRFTASRILDFANNAYQRGLEDAAAIVERDAVIDVQTEYQAQYNLTIRKTVEAIRKLGEQQ